ncbi:MAG: hypothetical protein GYB66_10985 [Chloroflexi bacterium]|nr:hypothetical protein [Chloroflexota bacterium]
MQRTREFWNAFRNFAIFFSFTINFVTVLVLLLVGMNIFQIKNGILEPLIDGLHANFVGLDEATIRTTVPVEDEIPVQFDLVVEDQTEVTLSKPAAIENVPATFEISGGGGTITGSVDITLPEGTPLTIDLRLPVPVDEQIPISLPVEVEIDLRNTELSVPFNNLRDLLEPYVRVLDNLPSEWDGVRPFTLDALNGEVDLLRETEGSRNPWNKAEQYPSIIPEAEQPAAGETQPAPADDAPASSTDTPNMPPGPTSTITPMPTPTITPFPSPVQQ